MGLSGYYQAKRGMEDKKTKDFFLIYVSLY